MSTLPSSLRPVIAPPRAMIAGVAAAFLIASCSSGSSSPEADATYNEVCAEVNTYLAQIEETYRELDMGEMDRRAEAEEFVRFAQEDFTDLVDAALEAAGEDAPDDAAEIETWESMSEEEREACERAAIDAAEGRC
ncbi:hypothetical protein HT102_08455 [Hoyosella sp. G463]|uniref:Uncharacterized protein n=1 Tax=Lolliginicoccus lacisalsi TaxID=2742202 RepID=A0A927JBZ8_9ACTN|nr:hypothetical protein [Lolliginicoccus lacisalsi]MBD8506514.1 hypothetical protein [Lolliginicoccus lacisalsi]